MSEKKGTAKKKNAGARRTEAPRPAASRSAGSSQKKTAKPQKGGNAAKTSSKRANAKNTRAKKPAAVQRRTNAPRQEEGNLVNELFFITIFAVALLLFLGNLGLGGTVGGAVGSFFFGLFGVMNYLFPAFLFAVLLFLFANRGNRRGIRKLPAILFLFAFLCALLHLITQGGYGFQNEIPEYFRISSEERTGGGLLGGLLIHVFTLGFGYIGAWVLTILGLFGGFLLLTGLPIFGQLKNRGSEAIDRATKRREENRRLREEERLSFAGQGQKPEPADIEEAASRRKGKAGSRKGQESGRGKEENEPSNIRIYGDFTDEDLAADEGVPFEMARDSDPSGRRERENTRDDRTQQDFADGVFPGPAGLPLTARREAASSPQAKGGVPSFLRGFVENTRHLKNDSAAYDDSLEEHLAKKRGSFAAAENLFPYEPMASPQGTENPAKATGQSASRGGFAANASGQTASSGGFAANAPVQKTSSGSMAEGAGATEPVSYSENPKTGQYRFAKERADNQDAYADSVPKDPTDPSNKPSRKGRAKDSDSADSLTDIREDIREEMRVSRGGEKNRLPAITLLNPAEEADRGRVGADEDEREKLEQVFLDFGVNADVANVSRGPSVTRYEVKPGPGVKVSRILALQNDIKLNLAAAEIRIEAPIPGKDAVGIEVPNKTTSAVLLRSLFESEAFKKKKAPLTFAVGKDLGGGVVVTDIEKMPHLLIAGATGSGKSVCINTLIMSVLYKSTPSEVRMVMIDPKVVELKIYDGIPHLLIPVVTDPKKAAGALNWAVAEMVERYNRFAEMSGVRDLASYNRRIEEINAKIPPEEQKKPMPRILVIVDELADLMMVAPGEVEDAICRLAQLARAAGIHLVIATQRPSVNVVTGLIKANMPSRIALAVSSGVDSRTIIDMNGAEKLLGKGDMLFYPQGYPKPERVQGAYVSDEEITRVVEFLKEQNAAKESDTEEKAVEEKILATVANGPAGAKDEANARDEYFEEAGRFIIEKDKASIGMLQRLLKIGFNRAARIMDQLAEAGVVGPEEGTKPRKILMTADEFEQYIEEYV